MLNRLLQAFTQSPDGKLWGIPIGTDLDIKQRYNAIITLPKGAGGAAVEKMVVRGSIIGRGANFTVTGDLASKQLIVTDSTATSPATKTVTFTRSSFANTQQPTMAEVVAALNAVFVLDATPIVASVGPKGELVITGAATSATGVLTIGPGSANQLLGFPEDGVTLKVDNAVGVQFILPATFDNAALVGRTPRVEAWDYTVATGVKTRSLNVGCVWTPSTRTMLITDITPTTGVTRQVALSVEI